MRVRCTNPRNYALTAGNVYNVEASAGNRYSIINDNGSLQTYSSGLFEEVAANTRVTNTQTTGRTGGRIQETTQRQAPTPPPAPARVRWTERDMVRSVQGRVHVNGRTIIISYNKKEFVDSQDNIVSKEFSLGSWQSNSFSCGAEGLVSVSQFNDTMWAGNNFVNFQQDDYEDLVEALDTVLAANLRSMLEQVSRRYFMASDVRGRKSERILELAGFVNVTGFHRNPNSNNDIAIYIYTRQA